MVCLNVHVLALLATASSLLVRAQVIGPVNSPKAQQDQNIIEGSFIVEFADDAAPMIFGKPDLIASVASTLRDALNIAGVTVDVPLDYKLFQGASFTIHDKKNAAALASELSRHRIAKNVWPNLIYHRLDLDTDGAAEPQSDPIGAGSGSPDYEIPAKIDREETFAPHIMTQVDKLHAEGIFGNGSIIAILDSGVDYELEALGGGFGNGFLIAKGFDFVGDYFNGANEPKPDADVMDRCLGHGTHTTGIIAAQPDNDFGILGAAPGATIHMYRVVGCSGATRNDILIQASLQAFEEGANIITASLSGRSEFRDNAWTVVVERIVAAGVPCTVSVSNAGSLGLFVPTGAGEGHGVASIASFDNIYDVSLDFHTNYTVDGGEPQDFGWQPGTPKNWTGVSLPLWAPSLNKTDPAATGCDPFPAGTPDLSGYITLLRFGDCDAFTAANNLVPVNGSYIIFYENFHLEAHGAYAGLVPGVNATAVTSAAQGEEWVALLAANKTVTVRMADPVTEVKRRLVYQPNPVTGGFLSFFTQWNPTYELEIKPSFGAPGGSILSTWPRPYNFHVGSGTSMSCPLVAAIYALVAQVRATYDPATIHTLLASTAHPQLLNDAVIYSDPNPVFPYLAPVAQQGNGMLRAYDAAYTKTLLSVPRIAFNDTDHLEPNANFTIRNLDTKDVTFKLGNVGAGTAYTFSPGDKMPAPFPGLETVANHASIDFDTSEVTVPAGGEALVSFTLTPPSNLDPKRIPVYSGFITLNGTNGENLSIAYQGVAGSMYSIDIMADAYLTDNLNFYIGPVPGGKNATYVIPYPTNWTADLTNNPVAMADLAFGSRLIDVQLIHLDKDNNEKNIGSIYGAPDANADRTDDFFLTLNGTMADGSVAPEGTYLFEFLALRIFGDLANKKDYQVLRSENFTIVYDPDTYHH